MKTLKTAIVCAAIILPAMVTQALAQAKFTNPEDFKVVNGECKHETVCIVDAYVEYLVLPNGQSQKQPFKVIDGTKKTDPATKLTSVLAADQFGTKIMFIHDAQHRLVSFRPQVK